MPVSGFTPVVDSSNSNFTASVNKPRPMAISPPDCSSPFPPMTNHLNGQNVDMDCFSVSSKMSAEQMMSDSELMDDFSNQISISPRSTAYDMKECSREKGEMDKCLDLFEDWNIVRQTEFIEQIIERMSFHQHEHFYSILLPMLQRDFITALPGQLFGDMYQ